MYNSHLERHGWATIGGSSLRRRLYDDPKDTRHQWRLDEQVPVFIPQSYFSSHLLVLVSKILSPVLDVCFGSSHPYDYTLFTFIPSRPL